MFTLKDKASVRYLSLSREYARSRQARRGIDWPPGGDAHNCEDGAPVPWPARLASSAGVERMFSKAGKLHDDLKASQADDSLEHALLASANCE